MSRRVPLSGAGPADGAGRASAPSPILLADTLELMAAARAYRYAREVSGDAVRVACRERLFAALAQCEGGTR